MTVGRKKTITASLDRDQHIVANLSNMHMTDSSKAEDMRYEIGDVRRRFPVPVDLFPLAYRGDKYHGRVEMDEDTEVLYVTTDNAGTDVDDSVDMEIIDLSIEEVQLAAIYLIGKLSRKT